jgi:hypothetical protein
MRAAHPLPTNSSRSAGNRRREFNKPPNRDRDQGSGTEEILLGFNLK